MGKDSKIAWTDHTFSPWWGCQRVSPGCEHCYAEAFAKRVGQKVWGPTSPRRFFGDKHWAEPLAWNRSAEKDGARLRVFCSSMADVFEAREDLDEPRVRLWQLIADTPALDWQLLTKRPENVLAMVPPAWLEGWPANAWLGTTTEDQKRLEARMAHMRRVPALVRFLSAEPLLEPLNLAEALPDVSWVIVGGESGPGARPCHVDWIRSIVGQCIGGDVPVFVKQLGLKPYVDAGALYEDFSRLLKLRDSKGGNWDEWDEDLRVRQFPAVL